MNANYSNVNVMNELEITKAALAVGWVKFSYYKADGTKRIAIGTTNRALIDQVRGYRMQEYRENKTYYSNCGYFDLSRCDWRQFNENRFIGLELSRLSDEDAVKIAITISYADAVNEESSCDRSLIGAILNGCERLVGHVFVVETFNFITETFVAQAPERAKISNNDIEEVFAVLHIAGQHDEQISNSNRENKKGKRELLIAELMKLRQRESEILAELLA